MQQSERFDMFLSAVGAVLRHRRNGLGLGLEQLASLTGLSESEVSQIEAGVSDVDLETFARLVLALNAKPSEVVRAAECREPASSQEPFYGDFVRIY